MQSSNKAFLKLKEIIHRDYGVSISDEQAQELGNSLLRITRIAVAVLARVEENHSSIRARESNSLGAKTSA
jgi:hypothetical protein